MPGKRWKVFPIMIVFMVYTVLGNKGDVFPDNENVIFLNG